MSNNYINRREIATMFNVSPWTVDRWWKSGILPPPIRLGNTFRWARAEVEERLAASRVTVASDSK